MKTLYTFFGMLQKPSMWIKRGPARDGRNTGSILPLVPIVAAAFLIVIANLVFITFRLLLPYPVSPWEAGIITDGWRMLAGDHVYALRSDHATHMYGPLVTVLLAQAFRLTGPVLYVGRLASAVSGLPIVAMVAWFFANGSRLAFGVAVALLLAANTRSLYYFTETRPDLDSLFFAALALIALYQGLEPARERPRLPLILIGTGLLVIAAMFKQTAATLTLIPVVSIAGELGGFSFRRRLLAAAIPFAGVFVTFGIIRLFGPGLWHFMVEVPAQYHVSALRMGRIALEFPTSMPLFLLALLHWLFTDARETWRLPQVRWLIAALICTVPFAILAFAKEGGSPNSLAPALFSVSAFCAWRAPVALALLRDAAHPLPLRTAAGAILGFLVFAHVYPIPWALSPAALREGHGVPERALVIAETRTLPGKVVCPDDPTIPLMAKGYAGRTAVFEADAAYWDAGRMQALLKEIASAAYVIVMQHGLMPGGEGMVRTVLNWGNWNKERMLRANGFVKVDFRTVRTPVYELWRRASPEVPSSMAR